MKYLTIPLFCQESFYALLLEGSFWFGTAY
jgi:hypothetical protein